MRETTTTLTADGLKQRLERILGSLRERSEGEGLSPFASAALLALMLVGICLGGDLERVLAEILDECRKAAEKSLKEEADEGVLK